jgi:hypothetical protein
MPRTIIPACGIYTAALPELRLFTRSENAVQVFLQGVERVEITELISKDALRPGPGDSTIRSRISKWSDGKRNPAPGKKYFALPTRIMTSAF